MLIERMRAAYATGDQSQIEQAALAFWSDDTIDEFPQSGEQFQGRSSAAALAAAYNDATGTHPSFALREVRGQDDFWVVEGTIDYGNGARVFAVTIVEISDGRIVRQTDYFASPFEAPEWRRPYRRRTPDSSPASSMSPAERTPSTQPQLDSRPEVAIRSRLS